MAHARVHLRRPAAVICAAAVLLGGAALGSATAGADTGPAATTTSGSTTTTGTASTTTATTTTTTGSSATTTSPGGQSITLGARCYLVGQHVSLKGSRFLGDAPYDITIDGVDFGQSVTSASGSFSASLVPGGLGAGMAQIVDTLEVSDGSTDLSATVTLTRSTGALFSSGKGSSARRKVPFEVWDFAPTGPPVPVYLHYVSPHGRVRTTVALGDTSGQCGYLRSAARELFPFNPSAGTWTLQFDTSKSYAAKPKGRVARIGVVIG